MDILEKIYKTNPNTQSITLAFQQIQNLQSFFPLLSKFPDLRELSLHGNLLASLPEDMSSLRSLESLDIGNNLFQDASRAIKGLISLPRLKNLTIDIKSQDDVQVLGENLPFLEKLNSKVIREPRPVSHKNEAFQPREASPFKKDSSTSEEEIGLTTEDLKAVALLYDGVRELIREQNPEKDNSLAEQFDEHVKYIIRDLTTKLNSKDSRAIKQTNVLKAKYALYEIVITKTIEYLGGVDPRVSSILEGIHTAHSILFKTSTNTNLYLLQKAIEEGKFSGSQMDQSSSSAGKIETAKLLEAAERMEKQNLKLRAEREELINQFSQEKAALQEQILSLEEDNQKLLDKLLRTSPPRGMSPSRYEKPRETQTLGEGVQQSSYKGGINDSYEKKNSYRSTFLQQQQSVAGHTFIRTLSLKQLKDIIEEIYASKAKYDQKALEGKQPRETMEMHMYTYLNQKYGLKNLIIEWATAIINGIKKYSAEDNDVAVFGKILKNELDEEFRFVQNHVKNTIQELLKMYLRGKYPLKHNSEIKDMLLQKMNGVVYEEECIEIIKYMYNQDDAEAVLSRLKKLWIQKNVEDWKKLPREEQLKQRAEWEKRFIEYSVFQKVILDFQLVSHEKFLRRCLAYFKLVDKDNNGIINEAEFMELIKYFEDHKMELDLIKLLMIVDPYNHQQITFSQCVALFSSEMVIEGDTSLSVLQKLALDG